LLSEYVAFLRLSEIQGPQNHVGGEVDRVLTPFAGDFFLAEEFGNFVWFCCDSRSTTTLIQLAVKRG
jgi:hypothetical protein